MRNSSPKVAELVAVDMNRDDLCQVIQSFRKFISLSELHFPNPGIQPMKGYKVLFIVHNVSPSRRFWISELWLAWSPDGTLLASGGVDDGTIRIWDTTSGWQLLRLDKHDGVWAVAWSPDGTRLAAAGNDGTVRIWSVP